MQRVEQDRSRALARARGKGPNFGLSEASSEVGDIEMDDEDDEEIDEEVCDFRPPFHLSFILFLADVEAHHGFQQPPRAPPSPRLL